MKDTNIDEDNPFYLPNPNMDNFPYHGYHFYYEDNPFYYYPKFNREDIPIQPKNSNEIEKRNEYQNYIDVNFLKIYSLNKDVKKKKICDVIK
jgi:hypothetical protein